MTDNVVLCFGEMLMRLSEQGMGPEFTSQGLNWYAGGAEANVSVGLSQLGHSTKFVSALPSNPLADALLEELTRHGVNTSEVLRSDSGRVGLYFHAKGVGVRPGRITYDRADSSFSKVDQSTFDFDRILSAAGWVHVSGITPAISQGAAEATCALVEAAQDRNVNVSFDFNHRENMWRCWGGEPEPYLLRIVQNTNVLFANDFDLSKIMDIPTADRKRALDYAEKALQTFPKLTHIASAFRRVITAERHELQAALVTRDGRSDSSSITLEGIVDRIGGGDAFASAIVSGILSQRPATQIVEQAIAAGALKHYVPGDFTRQSISALDRFIETKASDIQR